MSLSRSPSPQRGGGWSSPGLPNTLMTDAHSTTRPSPVPAVLSTPSHTPTPRPGLADTTWNHPVSHPSPNPPLSPFRSISRRLPFWKPRDFSDKEKLGRGRWAPQGPRLRPAQLLPFIARQAWKLKFPILLVLAICFAVFHLAAPLMPAWLTSPSSRGGDKFVIMLATNLGGGVMEWKGPKEWAIERDSVKNKRSYAKNWGYHLELVDMSTKKRYAHEWRESWEKVDTIRNAMRKYPHAQWFWWLDLHTFIMEPSYSLQAHIFDQLQDNVYRDINVYNPLNISHPLTQQYLDPETRSPIGDGKASSINLIIPQDCGGFNLGSFFIRRSPWTDRLLDIWWDPVGYEQKHMEWEHKEQDALEWMYINQPWVRPHVAFIPQRSINSFPPGACSDKGVNPNIHYDESDRDFLVNMAGCEWGRDCWGEMYRYRKLSEKLNRNAFARIKDWIKESLNPAKQNSNENKDPQKKTQ